MLESLSPTTSSARWTPKSASCRPPITANTGASRSRSCSRQAWNSATPATSASSNSQASEIHVRYAASVATIARAAAASARFGSSRSSCRTDATLAALESAGVPLSRPSFRRSALLLAALAALHGLVYVPLVDTNEKTDSWSYVASANALLDGGYSTPLQAGFYFVYPIGWFDITGARIAEPAWDEPERQVFRPPGYPAYLALFGQDKVFRGDHTAALIGQALLFGIGAYLLMMTVRRWWGENIALLGGLLYAVDPWSKHYVAL